MGSEKKFKLKSYFIKENDIYTLIFTTAPCKYDKNMFFFYFFINLYLS